MTVKLSFHDGYWYVDVRSANRHAYKPYARAATLSEALKKVEEETKETSHAKP